MSRAELLARYAKAYVELSAALTELPAGLMHYKPSATAWSVHEIVVHIADSEANSYIRLRRLVAEPGSLIQGYDQDRWAEACRYRDQSLATSLETFRWLRQASVELLALLPEQVWTHTGTHSESGHYTLPQWLEIYADHVPGHIAQMRRNLAAWEAAGRPAVQ